MITSSLQVNSLNKLDVDSSFRLDKDPTGLKGEKESSIQLVKAIQDLNPTSPNDT